MAILQALLTLIGRSMGKVLNAIFGWAVVALFGRTSPQQQTLLSGLVGMAAAWPILLLGIAFPKIAALAIAFVPLSDQFPSSIVRIVWIVLSLAVPITIGIVVAAKAPPGSPSGSVFTRMLRGFPITVAIAVAFLLMFITVPALRIASAFKGRKDEHLPLITSSDTYEDVASTIDRILKAHRIDVPRTQASWWLVVPTKALLAIGGESFRGFVPVRLAYWRGPALELALYQSAVLIRGKNKTTSWTRGLLAEGLTHGPGLETIDPAAQDLERQMQRVWHVLDERHAISSRALGWRFRDLCSDLLRLKVEYDDWQILYRQISQLGRALRGEPQILASLAHEEEKTEKKELAPMDEHEQIAAYDARGLAEASTRELLSAVVKETTELAKKQIELATAEIRCDVKAEIKAAKVLGVAALCGISLVNLLLVAVVFALSDVLLGWAAALVVAAFVLVVGAITALVGWSMRVKRPLERTQKTVKEDIQWAKEQLA